MARAAAVRQAEVTLQETVAQVADAAKQTAGATGGAGMQVGSYLIMSAGRWNGAANAPSNLGFVFVMDPAVPEGVQLIRATLDLTVVESGGTGALQYRVRDDDRTGPGSFTAQSDVNSRPRGTGSVDVTVTPGSAGSKITIDVTAVVAAHLAKFDFAGDHARLSFLLDNTGGDTGTYVAVTGSAGPTLPPAVLTLVYHDPDAPIPPTADFNVTPASLTGPAPLDIMASSTAQPGSSPIVATRWDFGDGSPVETTSVVQHAYAVPSAYQLQLQVEAQDGQTATATREITVTGGTEPPPDPAPGGGSGLIQSDEWPELVGLSAGESLTRNYNGVDWTLTLVSYNIVQPRLRVDAVLRVTGPGGATYTKTVRVGRQQADIALGGMRVYPFIEKEVDDSSPLEQAGQQGGLPAGLGNGSNDIAFLIRDAREQLFPPGVWPYPPHPWTGTHFQLFGEQNTASDIHSGHDVPTPGGTWYVAPYDGWFYPEANQATFVPDLPRNGGNSSLFQSPLSWVLSHITGSTATVSPGTRVTKGQQLVRSNNADRHFHVGGKGHQTGGQFLADMLLWEDSGGKSWSAPRWWRVSALLSGQADTAVPPSSFSGWKLVDSLIHGPQPVGNMAITPEFVDPHTQAGAAHLGAWVWSPAAQQATLKMGATRKAVVRINGNVALSIDNSARFAGLNSATEAALVADQEQQPVALQAGWNRVVITSDHATATSQRQWATALKIEGAGLRFSVRAIDAAAAGGQVSWSAVDHHNAAIDGYRIEVDNDPGFGSPQAYNAGMATSVPQGALPLQAGQVNYIRIVPYSSYGGDLPELGDIVSVNPGGVISVPPSRTSPVALADTPQFVVFGSDDNNRAGAMRVFRDICRGRTDAGGHAVRMSWYLIGTNIYGPNISSPQWRDEYMGLFEEGHEIGNHGFWGLASDFPRGTVENWRRWIGDTHDALLQLFDEYGYTLAQAEAALRGYRASQDIYDPAMHTVLKEYGYEYGCSTHTGGPENQPAYYPGTIENGWPGNEPWDGSQVGQHPGQWEMCQSYIQGSLTCDKDFFDPPQSRSGAYWKDAVLALVAGRRAGNKAPVSVCMHSQDWGPTNVGGSSSATQLERQQAFMDLLDTLKEQFPDVRIVTQAQLLDWMANPVTLVEFDAGTEPPPPPPPVNSQPSIPAIPDITQQGLQVTIDVPFADADAADQWSATVDWGDATPVESAVVNQATKRISDSHTYAVPGSRTVTVRVQDARGLSATQTLQVTTSEPPAGIDVTVDISAAQEVGTVAPRGMSAALTEWNHMAGIGTYPGELPQLIQMARLLGVGSVRYGWGNGAQTQGWTRRQVSDRGSPGGGVIPWASVQVDEPVPGSTQRVQRTRGYYHVYRPDLIQSLNRFKEEVGCDIIMQCNVLDNNPASVLHDDGSTETFPGGMWTDMFRYANIENSFGFKFAEIGNELDYVKPWGHDGTTPHHIAAATEYTQRFINRYYLPLKALDPSIQVLGPVTAHPARGSATGYTWPDVFMAGCAAAGIVPDEYSLHYYANPGEANGPASPDPDRGWAPESVMSYNRRLPGSVFGAGGSVIPDTDFLIVVKRRFPELFMDQLHQRMLQHFGRIIPTTLSEWRWMSALGSEPVHAFPINVPWMVDNGMRLMHRGVTKLEWYDLYETSLLGGMVGSNEVRTPIYGGIILRHLRGINALQTSVNVEGAGAFGTKDTRANGDIYWAMLVNPDGAERDYQVNLNGLPQGAVDRYTVWRFERDAGIGWNTQANGQQVSISGFKVNVNETAEQNETRLYNAGMTQMIQGAPSMMITLRPYDTVAIAFSKAPVPPPLPIPPVVHFTINPSPATGPAPLQVAIASNGSAPKASILGYEIEYGDGTTETISTDPTGRTHTYNAPNTYTLRIRAFNAGGFSEWWQATVTVTGGTPPVPVPDLQWSVPNPADPALIRFDARGSENATKFVIDPGDGSAPYDQPLVDHRYAEPGEYTAELDVSNSFHTVDPLLVTVTVEPPAGAVTAGFTATVDQSNPFRWQFVYNGKNAARIVYDFADGTAPVEEPNPVHVFEEFGSYLVEQRVFDEFGNEQLPFRKTIRIEAIQAEEGGGIGAALVTAGAFVGVIILNALGGKQQPPGRIL